MAAETSISFFAVKTNCPFMKLTQQTLPDQLNQGKTWFEVNKNNLSLFCFFKQYNEIHMKKTAKRQLYISFSEKLLLVYQ